MQEALTLEQLRADAEVDDHDLPMLLRAARGGHAEIVAQLLAQSPEMVDGVDDYGQTALHCAGQGGHVEVIKQLLAHKPALIDVRDSFGGSLALHDAIEAGHGKVVALLLAHKPETIDMTDSDGANAWHLAVSFGHEHIVEQLLSLKPSLIDETWYGKTALHIAASAGRDGVVAKLLALRPSLCDMKDSEGCTALHLAVKIGHNKIVERLLAFSPHLYLGPANSSDTPLHSAASRYGPGCGKIVSQLLAYDPTWIDARNSDGRNALHRAVLNGHEEVVAVLLAHKPELIDSSETVSGQTALHLAASMNEARIVSQLIAIRPSLVHEVDSNGRTALFYGVRNETVDLLLPLTPEQVFMRDCDGNTLLHRCLPEFHWSELLSKELVERVWRMNPEALYVTNANGLTPFQFAANHERAFELFQWKFSMDDIVQALAARQDSQAEAPLQRVRPLVVGKCNAPLLECLNQDLVDTVYEYLGFERCTRKRKHE